MSLDEAGATKSNRTAVISTGTSYRAFLNVAHIDSGLSLSKVTPPTDILRSGTGGVVSRVRDGERDVDDGRVRGVDRSAEGPVVGATEATDVSIGIPMAVDGEGHDEPVDVESGAPLATRMSQTTPLPSMSNRIATVAITRGLTAVMLTPSRPENGVVPCVPRSLR
jgi:hypothetical protein